MSKNIKRINQRVLKFQESEDSWYNVIEKTTTEFDDNNNKVRKIFTENNYREDTFIYEYRYDNDNRIISIKKIYFEYGSIDYEKLFLYDNLGNNIKLIINDGVGNPFFDNIFEEGKIIKSICHMDFCYDTITWFRYDEKGVLYKKENNTSITIFNQNGTIKEKIDTSGNNILRIPYETKYNFNFMTFCYDDMGNDISGKGGIISFKYEKSGNNKDTKVANYDNVGIKATWKILYTFDKFGNWITKLYIVNDKPSTLIEREIKYYDKGKSFEIS